jgi:hypothetical protein
LKQKMLPRIMLINRLNERHCFHFSPGAEMKQLYWAMWMCLTVGLTALPGQDATPSMVVDNPVKDFGKVMKGDLLKHTFRISNEGSSTLEILDLEATCGCQTSSLSAKQIEAGQSGHIDVSVDTTVLIGAVTESVKIMTNDPLHPSFLLSVKADVQPEISLSSPSIYFGDVPRGKEVTEEIIITVPAEKSIKILSAESSDESVKVRLEPVTESKGKKTKLIATYRADGKIGYRLGDITVKTTSYLTPELSINLIIRNFNR